MVRFFQYIGDVWQILALSIMTLLFLSFVTGVVVNKLRDSYMSLTMIILYYCIIFAFWTVILLLGVPALIKYFIGLY